MTFLKIKHTECFMAIFPERNSQGGYRSVYFYIESATSFKVMFNIFKHICLDTRKDTMWQVMSEKYPEQCTSWSTQRLKYVLLRPAQNWQWHCNELRGSLVWHLQTVSNAGQPCYFPQRVCYQTREMWPSLAQLTLNSCCLLLGMHVSLFWGGLDGPGRAWRGLEGP